MKLMEYEIIWHSVVDVAYMVEADSEEDAIERLQIYLVDGHEGNDVGITLKGEVKGATR